jgi:hypothetical protein
VYGKYGLQPAAHGKREETCLMVQIKISCVPAEDQFTYEMKPKSQEERRENRQPPEKINASCPTFQILRATWHS